MNFEFQKILLILKVSKLSLFRLLARRLDPWIHIEWHVEIPNSLFFSSGIKPNFSSVRKGLELHDFCDFHILDVLNLIVLLLTLFRYFTAHWKPLFYQLNVLERAGEKLVWAAIFICGYLWKRDPFCRADLLDILNIDSFLLSRLKNAHNIEVSCSILVINLFSHRQDALEFSFYSSFFEGFSFNTLLDGLSLVDIPAWEFPLLISAFNSPSFLDQ